jgi:hypothetical protein
VIFFTGLVIYLVNLCTRTQILSMPHSISGSNSDILTLVAKSNNSIKSNSLVVAAGLERTASLTPMREIEWKPADERRNGWIEVEEKEVHFIIY